MKVLVSGGNGFVGSHVVDHLLAAGHKACMFSHPSGYFRKQFRTMHSFCMRGLWRGF